MLTTAAVLGALAALGARERDAGPLVAAPTATAAVTPEGPAGAVVARAAAATNVYALPDRAAELVAILPGGQTAVVEGRSEDGAWLHVVYPPGSTLLGWVPAAVLTVERGASAALPVVTTDVPVPAAGSAPPASEQERLPDLTITEAFLLEDGRLAVGIRNIGTAALVQTVVPLRVTKAEGDILGVLEIGPTTLGPGARATVVTPVVVTEAGNYRIVLDAPNGIAESQESNNAHTTLLIPKG